MLTAILTDITFASLKNVSIIIPAYNRISFLAEAIKSVYSQTHPEYEIIVIDDASSDGTSAYITANHPQVRLLTLPKNRGAAYARNQGIKICQGEIIAFLDSDDLWADNYLSSQIDFLEKNPNLSAVFSSHTKLDADSEYQQIKHKWPIEEPQLQLVCGQNYIHTMSIFVVRKSVFLMTGHLNEELRICHDREFYIRLLEHFSIGYNKDNLVMRRYSANQVTQNIPQWYKEARKILHLFFSSPNHKKYSNIKHSSYFNLNQTFRERALSHNLSLLRYYCQIMLWWYSLKS